MQGRSRDDALYGVFGGGDDDGGDGEHSDSDSDWDGEGFNDGAASRRNRGGGKGGRKPKERLNKPMAFVSGGVKGGNAAEEGKSDRRGGDDNGDGSYRPSLGGGGRRGDTAGDDDNEEDDEGGGYGGLGLGLGLGRKRRRRGFGGESSDEDDDGVEEEDDESALGDSAAQRSRRGPRPRSSDSEEEDADARPSFGGLGSSSSNNRADAADDYSSSSARPTKPSSGMTNAAFRALLSGVGASSSSSASSAVAGDSGTSSRGGLVSSASFNSNNSSGLPSSGPGRPQPSPSASGGGIVSGGSAKGVGSFFAQSVAARQASAASSSSSTASAAAGGNRSGGSGSAKPPVKGPVGTFEKHTKGFASKYLDKFGFKGRLGKDEQGIAQPVAVQVRPERLGLAYGRFKEASQLKQNRQLMKEVTKGIGAAAAAEKEEDEDEEGGHRKKGKRGGSDDDDFWSGDLSLASAEDREKARLQAAVGGGARKRPSKKVYKTAAELLSAENAAGSGPSLASGASAAVTTATPILDMRGPTVRVLSSLAEAGQEAPAAEDQASLSADEGAAPSKYARLGQELLHNVSLLADTAEAGLHAANRKLKAAEHSIAALSREAAARQAAAAAAAASAESLTSAHGIIANAVVKLRHGLSEIEGKLAEERRAAAAAETAAAAAAARSVYGAAVMQASFPFYGMARLKMQKQLTASQQQQQAAAAASARAWQQHGSASADGGLSHFESALLVLDDAGDALELVISRYPAAVREHRLWGLGPALVHSVLEKAAPLWNPPVVSELPSAPSASDVGGSIPVPLAPGAPLSSCGLSDEPTIQLISVLRRWVGLITRAAATLAVAPADGSASAAAAAAAADDDGSSGSETEGQQGGATILATPRLPRAASEVASSALSHLRSVLDATLIPRLRWAVTNVWAVVQQDRSLPLKQPRALVALLTALAPASAASAIDSGAPLPPAAESDLLTVPGYRSLLETCVLPVLGRAVDAWDPRTDPVPVHAWTLPWTAHHLVGPAPAAARLWPPLRQKFASVLVEWHPSDPSAHVMLAPWAPVWGPRATEGLLARSVVPKLAAVLRDQLAIDPRNQSLEPLHWVLAWADLLPPPYISALLEGELLPKWMAALLSWLRSPAVDYGEVTTWYLGWKAALPAPVLELPRIQAAFGKALDVMNDAVSGELPGGDAVITAAGGVYTQEQLLADLRHYDLPAPGQISYSSILEATRGPSDVLAAAGAGAADAAQLPAVRGAGASAGGSHAYQGYLQQAPPPPGILPGRLPTAMQPPQRAASGVAALAAEAAAALRTVQAQRAAASAAAAAAASSSSSASSGTTPREGGSSSGASSGESLSFREMVEVLASERGLQLLPHPRRPSVQGNVVYRLGAVCVYFSGGVAFMERQQQQQQPPSNASASSSTSAAAPPVLQYVPVGIDQLLDAAAAGPAAKRA